MSTRDTVFSSEADRDEVSIFWDYAEMGYFLEVKSIEGKHGNLTSEYVIVPLPEELRLRLRLPERNQ